MIFSPKEATPVAARNSMYVAVFGVLLLASCIASPGPDHISEYRQLTEENRIRAFHQLDDKAKVDLFFEANRRHPPYSGLNSAIAEEGVSFLAMLRDEIDKRGGVPEVLSFMSIAFDMKVRGALTQKELHELRIAGICQLAEESEYCPTLEARILAR